MKQSHTLSAAVVLEVAIIILSLVVLTALIVVINLGYRLNWDWAGLRQKTLWDWLQLLIIPAVLAVAGYVINLTISRSEQEATKQWAKSEQEIALDNQREEALQAYIDKMSELLLKDHLGKLTSDRKLKPEYEEVRTIAEARTLTVLPRLDSKRKRSILQFLHKSRLILKDNTILELKEADLRGANLTNACLSLVKLTDANLTNTILSGADLRGGQPQWGQTHC